MIQLKIIKVVKNPRAEFKAVHIIKEKQKVGSDKVYTVLEYSIYDDNGNIHEVRSKKYEGEEHNKFWEDFNNGKYLYEQIVQIERVDGVTFQDTIEREFKNKTISNKKA